MQKNIDPNISRNFHVLKVSSIFMVFFGHYFTQIEIAWVPVAVGLVIFSFSSAYFTALKYDAKFDIIEFYKKKIVRLGPNIFVINLILFFLFVFQGQDGIITWQTLFNLFGLNGFLEWFRIDNPSPYGKAMWFLTLLLVFYLIYPLMNKINGEFILYFGLICIGLFYLLSFYVQYGHALWLTCCGFVLGFCAGKQKIYINSKHSFFLILFFSFCLLFFNVYLNINIFNFIFILFFSFCFIHFFWNLTIQEPIFLFFNFFSGIILEIYLLHPYFLLHVTGRQLLDFSLSVLLVVFLSIISSFCAKKIRLILCL